MPFLGWLSDPFKWLSDLQLRDEKVTLNHLEVHSFFSRSFLQSIFGSSDVNEIFEKIQDWESYLWICFSGDLFERIGIPWDENHH